MRYPRKLVPLALVVATLVATALAWSAITAAQRDASPRITADLTFDGTERIALHGKRRSPDRWATKTDIAALPCAGRHRLAIVTRFFGAEPNHRTVYRVNAAAPRVVSGRARCGRPVPARYGNARVTVTLQPRNSDTGDGFSLSGHRAEHGGKFDLGLRFSSIACAGRYVLRIDMDGPREPLRVRYRARVGVPRIDGQPRECGR